MESLNILIDLESPISLRFKEFRLSRILQNLFILILNFHSSTLTELECP